MIFQNPPFRRSSAARTAGLLLLSMMIVATGAHAADQDITLGGTIAMCNPNPDYSYGAFPTQVVNDVIGTQSVSGTTVQWSIDKTSTDCPVSADHLSASCANGLKVTIKSLGEVAKGDKPTLTGTGAAANSDDTSYVTLKVLDNAANTCGIRKYFLHSISNGSGWGDPHMTTVDGVAYDFQGAGEFIALKGYKFEVQTRQRPVPTANPATDPHTGLKLCVSTYSAVALLIGSNRVALEPYVINGQPDPTTLQLWVNDNLVPNIPEGGYQLRVGGSSDPSALLEGRIVRPNKDAYEFDTVDGTQLVATPAYWTSQQTWYMDLRAYQTSAFKGIWGRLASGSWLPALSDGTSIPLPMPDGDTERYQALYDKFGNSWRVTQATRKFHYPSGITVADWPRLNPQSCTIQGQTPATPTTQQAAEQACSAIMNPAEKANCTFDVMVTGNAGFAQTYATAAAFKPHGSGWQPSLPGTGSTAENGGGTGTGGTGGWKDWPWWVWVLILILVLILIALFMRKKATP